MPLFNWLAATQPSITGVESWASPILYFFGAATILTTTLTAARFQSSSHREHPTTRWIVATLIVLAGTLSLGIALLAAIITHPLGHHVQTAVTLWAIGTLPAALVCLRQPS